MSVHTRSLAGLLALLALGWAGPAAAQAERTWTDPPARGAAAPPAADPAPPKVAEAPKAQARPHAAPRIAAQARGPRVAAVRRRPVAVVRALTPTRPGLARAPVRVIHARVAPRTPVPQAWGPGIRPVRYGYVAPPPGAGDDDPRARRIRQAEAAGYLVVRRSTVAAPDGRLLYGYRPYEADDAED